MFYCEKCGISDACERTDLVNDPVLCDECYKKEIYGECNCDSCSHGYYLGDRLYCRLEHCNPLYDI